MSSSPPQTEAPKKSSGWKKGLAIASACGVLGVLILCAGAIATPKFAGFGCRAKQSEAKTNLMGLYTAEKVFHAEYGSFTTDLNALPWAPDGSPLYAYGFATPSSARSIEGVEDYDPTRRTTTDPRVAAAGRYVTRRMRAVDGRVFGDADFASFAATATSAGFTAFAIGDIDTDTNALDLDIWSIDHERNLQLVRNDCTS